MLVESYRPISLLPTIPKHLEKLVHKRIQEDLDPQEWVPDHQFGFRRAHSTVQQCHRIVDVINKSIENQQYCTAAFLDVTKAFDRVWHKCLLVKIKHTLPPRYFKLLTAYLHNREFEVKVADSVSKRYIGFRRAVSSAHCYKCYTLLYLPVSGGLIVGTFSDDTAIWRCMQIPSTHRRNYKNTSSFWGNGYANGRSRWMNWNHVMWHSRSERGTAHQLS
jgi:RNase P subunit RPR2